MDYKILFSDVALIDFEELLGFIRKDNESAAQRFGDSVLNHIGLLAQFPYLGAPMRVRPGVREMLHTPFRIYYRVYEDRKAIEVIQIWHQSRRTPSLPG